MIRKLYAVRPLRASPVSHCKNGTWPEQRHGRMDGFGVWCVAHVEKAKLVVLTVTAPGGGLVAKLAAKPHVAALRLGKLLAGGR